MIFFMNFQTKSKLSFFLLLTAMCYDHDEDIKSYFLTSGKPKKQKQSQNNAYNILEMKVKNN
jgi:DNA-directed RNA polymerase beta subunit